MYKTTNRIMATITCNNEWIGIASIDRCFLFVNSRIDKDNFLIHERNIREDDWNNHVKYMYEDDPSRYEYDSRD